eukprot:CAMPEP_0115455900 /NCGR_PEP_ID=MMETSP0271-20121206/44399_1 /TAXON_ID=71861 /ORGANISM="Scrippsiella trochoidea, Strain CCMP3099" /LENGTH=87 /DNA_ID=CAMNT_0002882375 /DNA_START=42 /DNA_END=301 /DNA_ORIENTATION=+
MLQRTGALGLHQALFAAPPICELSLQMESVSPGVQIKHLQLDIFTHARCPGSLLPQRPRGQMDSANKKWCAVPQSTAPHRRGSESMT